MCRHNLIQDDDDDEEEIICRQRMMEWLYPKVGQQDYYGGATKG
jgi:hypothetical protein